MYSIVIRLKNSGLLHEVNGANEVDCLHSIKAEYDESEYEVLLSGDQEAWKKFHSRI